MNDRIGLFGGTFDPVHNAHLEIARAAADQCHLREVLFVPAGNPPHRTTSASYADRFQMVELATAADTRFHASRLEEHARKSYSTVTVENLRRDLPDTTEIFFIIGADAFAEVPSWHRWKELLALVTFAVVERPGATYAIPPQSKVVPITGVQLPISASEIRAKLVHGDSDVPLPLSVYQYIRSHHLYTSSTPQV